MAKPIIVDGAERVACPKCNHGFAHAERSRDPHPRAGGGGVLDERGGLAVRADADGLGSLRGGSSAEGNIEREGCRWRHGRRSAGGDRVFRTGTSHPVGAYFEAHIEQGPVLEDTKTTIGVVQGALGQRWFDVVFTGQDSHAGPTPMELRKDALIAASRLVLEVNRIATTYPDYARGTVGHMRVKPNSRNVVPGEVRMTVDLRNAKDATLTRMRQDLEKSAQAIAAQGRVGVEVKEVVYFPPCEFASELVASVRNSAKALGLSHRDIVSGAAHDAVYLARVAPTAMIFVPCEAGISHNEIENARPEDLAAGCDVLLQAVLATAS
jgi:N-carbamoyl-L-amino-acid hydrolase